MKNLFMLFGFTVLLYSCTSDDFVSDLENKKFNSVRSSNYGLVHNQGMEYIFRNINSELRQGEHVEDAVLSLTIDYLTSKGYDLSNANHQQLQLYRFMAKNDYLLIHFQANIDNIKKMYEDLRNDRVINSQDLELINQLIDLLKRFNQNVIDQNASAFEEELFIKQFEQFYKLYDINKTSFSSISIGLMEIASGSLAYWRNQDLTFAPDFITVKYSEEIIPAILLRVIITDAIGAIEGAIMSGLAHRLSTNDWNWDSGKISEDEALIGMLLGAVTSSGGFLGRMAARALRFL